MKRDSGSSSEQLQAFTCPAINFDFRPLNRQARQNVRAVWGNRKLRFALIGVAVAVFVGLVWLVWPSKAEDLTVSLKVVRTGIHDGNPVVFFRLQGAERYEVSITYCYLLGDQPTAPGSAISFDRVAPTREFWVTPALEYSPEIGDRSWRLQAKVYILAHEKNSIGRVFKVAKAAWQIHSNGSKSSIFSIAQANWRANRKVVISEQTITSELITNTPPH